MVEEDPQASYWRLAIGSRIFAVLIVAIPLSVSRDATSVLCLAVVGLIWAAVTVADRYATLPALALVLEAVLVGVTSGVPDTTAVLTCLAVPPFTAGLRGGLPRLVITLALEIVSLLAVTLGLHTEVTSELTSVASTWLLVGVGLGLIASYHRSTTQPPDPLAPYRAAQSLLRELIDLSGDLNTSLDAVALGSAVAEIVRDEVPVTAVVVQVPREDALTPITSTVTAAEGGEAAMDEVALRSWRAEAPQVSGQVFAFPLTSEARVVAVVSGLLPTRLDPQDLVISGQLTDLSGRLETLAVQLDTALMFSRLRDSATADERRRLAREIHDGVAQDIVSLGYLVDALAATPANPDQAERLGVLRQRISAVVAEVRRSVQTLRTDAGASASLGAAVSSLARHLSESASIPIRVTVDEGTVRLRPEVESEVLRIAQEAMTNAVRHAQPTAVEVLVRVAAPAAEIVVRDDGHGMRPGRADSHGLSIMKERAALIDGDLQIEGVFPQGTEVRLGLGPARVPPRSAAEDGTVAR